MDLNELSERLRRKAGNDEQSMLVLRREPVADDAAIGFFAQQAVEKLLKSLLAHRGIRFPRTHELPVLIDLLRDNGVTVPPWAESITRLQPYAVEFRYDDLPDPAAPLDRAWAGECVRAVRVWVDAQLALPGGGA